MARSKASEEAFQAGRLSGIAEEHVRGISQELEQLRQGQAHILVKLDELNKWRWIVVGIASAIAFLISVIVESIKGIWK